MQDYPGRLLVYVYSFGGISIIYSDCLHSYASFFVPLSFTYTILEVAERKMIEMIYDYFFASQGSESWKKMFPCALSSRHLMERGRPSSSATENVIQTRATSKSTLVPWGQYVVISMQMLKAETRQRWNPKYQLHFSMGSTMQTVSKCFGKRVHFVFAACLPFYNFKKTLQWFLLAAEAQGSCQLD